MQMPAVNTGGGFEKCPAGNHLAVCFEVIDLGTQKVVFQDETKQQRKVWIGWETPGELNESGQPYTIGKRYTFSSHERASLRKDLESWRGQAFSDERIHEFNIKDVIGHACFLSVVHTANGDRTYANIASIAALPKGTATPQMHNSPVYVSLDPDEFDPQAYEGLSDWMKGKILESPEGQSIVGAMRPASSAGVSFGGEEIPY